MESLESGVATSGKERSLAQMAHLLPCLVGNSDFPRMSRVTASMGSKQR